MYLPLRPDKPRVEQAKETKKWEQAQVGGKKEDSSVALSLNLQEEEVGASRRERKRAWFRFTYFITNTPCSSAIVASPTIANATTTIYHRP